MSGSGDRVRWLHSFFALFVIALSLPLARSAAASERSSAELHYERGPASCPDENTFRSGVMARLGYDPFAEQTPPPRRVELALRSTGRGFAAKLSIVRDGKSSTRDRDGTGETCASLVESLATTVAMALDPIAASGPKTAPEALPLPPLPAASVIATKAESPPSAETIAPPAPAPAQWSGHAVASSGAGLGELPGASIAGALAFEARRARLGGVVDGRFATGPDQFRSTRGDEMDATLITGGAGPCLFVSVFATCAHLRVGALRARSETVERPVVRSALHVEAAASARVRLPLGSRVELFGLLELGAALNPISVRISGDEVWNAPPVFARLGVGGSLRVF